MLIVRVGKENEGIIDEISKEIIDELKRLKVGIVGYKAYENLGTIIIVLKRNNVLTQADIVAKIMESVSDRVYCDDITILFKPVISCIIDPQKLILVELYLWLYELLLKLFKIPYDEILSNVKREIIRLETGDADLLDLEDLGLLIKCGSIAIVNPVIFYDGLNELLEKISALKELGIGSVYEAKIVFIVTLLSDFNDLDRVIEVCNWMLGLHPNKIFGHIQRLITKGILLVDGFKIGVCESVEVVMREIIVKMKQSIRSSVMIIRGSIEENLSKLQTCTSEVILINDSGEYARMSLIDAFLTLSNKYDDVFLSSVALFVYLLGGDRRRIWSLDELRYITREVLDIMKKT